MPPRYRVITVNTRGNVSVESDWQTYSACRRAIISRWGHWPPFAHISTIEKQSKLQRRYGFSTAEKENE